MDTERKALLVFGFAREHCTLYDIHCATDIIEMFKSWLVFGDHFASHLSHSAIEFGTTKDDEQTEY